MGLKRLQADNGNILKENKEITINDFKHPIFCFKYIHTDYSLNHCNADEKIALIEQIMRLSNMSWEEIQFAPRHGMGSEKISREAIRPALPKLLTEDVKHLLALRFYGKAPFVGWRNKFVFHVLYIDRGFKLYKH